MKQSSDNITCKICNEETKYIRQGDFTRWHIQRDHNISPKKYYDSFFKKENEGNCKNCNKETKFLGNSYNMFCSPECKSIYIFNTPSYNINALKAREKTCLLKFNHKNAFQSKEIQEKIKITNLKKYGVENPSQLEEIKQKKIDTCLKNYNVKHPGQSKEIQEKTINANIKKYGTEYATQSNKVKEKTKKTNLEKYGVENVMHIPEIADRAFNNACKYKDYI